MWKEEIIIAIPTLYCTFLLFSSLNINHDFKSDKNLGKGLGSGCDRKSLLKESGLVWGALIGWSDRLPQRSFIWSVSSQRDHITQQLTPRYYARLTMIGSHATPRLNATFKMGLFPAIDCIKLIVIAFTRENDLFKKLKQWLWQPQFSRRNVFGEVLLGDRGFSSVLRDSECTEDVSA